MHVLPSTLTTLILSILGSIVTASNDGNPQASKYTDPDTNITFLGFADGTGFKFGMALPSKPNKDLILQLVGPLKNGGGWTGVDFGSEMTGYLLLCAWPGSNSDSVMISPRIATGYEVSDGANIYKANPINITQIPTGTFVNSTHVSATFVCGNCLNKDSFNGTARTATFSYAYALEAVADPGNVNTQLSDHTANGEPYGPFDVAVANAESSEYAKFLALTKTATATPSAGAASATSAGAAATGSSSSSSSSSGGTSGSSSSSSPAAVDDATSLSAGGIFALVGLGLIYVLQAVQIL